MLAENQELSVRLMTTADLADMKAKRNPSHASSLASSAQKVPKTDKRYLILSLEGEFEKVHYPLPLVYTEEPDMQTMFRTFQRMSSQLGMSQTVRDDGGFDLEVASQRLPNTMQDFFKIEVENESLRSELLEVQSSFTAQDREYLELAHKKATAETEYDAYRSEAQSEIGQLLEVVRDKEDQLARLQEQLESARNPHADNETTRVRQQLESLTGRFEAQKNANDEHIKEQSERLADTAKAMEESKEAETANRERLAQL